MSIYITNSDSQTKKLGENLGKAMLKNKKKMANVLALEGDLGGGKTTFLQGLAKGLGISEKILSPTFVILKKFKIPDKNFKEFYHLDCYRIKNKEEILMLGLKDVIRDGANIIAIEWADNIKEILPKDCLRVRFFLLADKRKAKTPNKAGQKRKITISNNAKPSKRKINHY